MDAATEHLRSPERVAKLMRRAAWLSVGTALGLIALKASAFAITDSLSLLASLVDSLLDLAASLVNAWAISHALRPADPQHRFGHGKAESLAGLAQAAIVGSSAGVLAWQAVSRLTDPPPLQHGAVGVGVMALSMVATLFLVQHQRMVVRESGSLAIRADSLHYASDMLMNGAVIVSIGLSVWMGWRLADPICAILVAFWIAWSAFTIAREAVDVLMDRELDAEERSRIEQLAVRHPAVDGIHDLRTRRAGPQVHIQFHLELDARLTLGAAHTIADEVEAIVREGYGDAEVLIHIDPDDLPPDEPFPMI